MPVVRRPTPEAVRAGVAKVVFASSAWVCPEGLHRDGPARPPLGHASALPSARGGEVGVIGDPSRRGIDRVLEVAPGSSDLAAAGNSAAYNVGIAGGSLLGAGILPTLGVRGTALVGGVLVAAALAVLLAEPLVAADRRAPVAGAEPARAEL